MAFNNLDTLKKINGIPADIRYFEKIAENDSFLKQIVDLDENLEALDRDIVPITTDTYRIGSSSKTFSEVNTSLLRSLVASLSAGSLNSPSLKIGTAGLASLANDQLSFVGTNGLESFRFMTSGCLVKAANNTQLKIENTFPSTLAQWSLGVDSTGFSFINSEQNLVKLKIKNDELSVINKINVPAGSPAAPSLYFGTDVATGFYKDESLPVLNFSVSGASKFSLSSDEARILSSKLTLPEGTQENPGIVFFGAPETGFFSIDPENIGLSFNGEMIHKFSREGFITETEGFVSLNQKRVYATPGTLSWHIDSFGRANGTKLIPTPILQDEELYVSLVEAFTDTGWQRVTDITVMSTEDYSSGTYGSKMSFSIIPAGMSTAVEVLNLGNLLNCPVHIPLSLGLSKGVHSTPGNGQQVNVAEISKLMIDTSSGNMQIKGFTGGKEGQILYVYKKVPTNSLTIIFNDATATQKILLKGSTNYVNTNDYGGITLSFDDGVWREVSRS